MGVVDWGPGRAAGRLGWAAQVGRLGSGLGAKKESDDGACGRRMVCEKRAKGRGSGVHELRHKMLWARNWASIGISLGCVRRRDV